MNMLIAFAPFIAFAVLHQILGLPGALSAATALSLIVVICDWRNNRSVKVLEVSSVLLFGGLALYSWFTQHNQSLFTVRLLIDGGFMLIALGSLAVGKPFTLQYAKEKVPPVLWQTARFIQINQRITLAWALAFGVMALSDIAMLYRPGLPLWVSGGATVIALVAAIKFTQWYPGWIRSRQ